MIGETLKGHLDLLLLVVLEKGPAHGYAVIEALRSAAAVCSTCLKAPFIPLCTGWSVRVCCTAAGRKIRVTGNVFIN